jgi:hypothetical protein
MSASEVPYSYDEDPDFLGNAPRDQHVESRPVFTFAEYEPLEQDDVWPTNKGAIQAAILGAVASLMIGIGIAILIVVF